MICAYKVAKEIKRLFEEREVAKRESNLDFFFNSMSDETYLDMIRERIEFMIDEGYKFSEQLEIINRESGRNIRYSTYTKFVKLFMLEAPENVFRNREFERYYGGYIPQQNSQQPQKRVSDDEVTEPKKRVERKEKFEFTPQQEERVPDQKEEPSYSLPDTSYEKGSVPPLKKPKIKSTDRNKVSFKHEAMPNVEELY